MEKLSSVLNSFDQEAIVQYLESFHPFDLSKEFFALNKEDQELFMKFASAEMIAEVLSYNPEDSAEILVNLDPQLKSDVISNLELDDVVDILNELNNEDQESIIALQDEQDKADVRELLEYKEKEVGAHMNTSFISVLDQDDVKVATKKLIEQGKEVEHISTIFVVDEKNIYLGTIPLNSLLKARSPLKVTELIENTSKTLDTNFIENAINDMRNYSLTDMPVISAGGSLEGIITLDDAIEVLKEETDEDLRRLTGISTKDRRSKPLIQSLRRLPWLILFLGLSLLVTFITGIFENILILVPMLMIFEPLVLDAGGDVGSQTLGITLSLLQKKSKKLKNNVVRELITSLINGIIEGLIAFGITIAFGYITNFNVEIMKIALVVGLSLCVTVVFAPLIAIIVPITLKLFKFDPAIASGPFITTLIDISSLLIYFSFALIFLGGLL
ncbi:MAG: magnesium transporter [Acholeplasmatales bacterium]|jgi:magnesium transporter|nr:magnesium transporter [Acholeplasmatales bacterium]